MDATTAKQMAREARDARLAREASYIIDVAEAQNLVDRAAAGGEDEVTLRLETGNGPNPHGRGNQIRQALELVGYEVERRSEGDVVFVRITWANAPGQALAPKIK